MALQAGNDKRTFVDSIAVRNYPLVYSISSVDALAVEQEDIIVRDNFAFPEMEDLFKLTG